MRRDIISPDFDREIYMEGLFTILKDDTFNTDADYGVAKAGRKNFYILLGQNYSIASLCVLHGHVQVSASENPKKWLFLVEENPFSCAPEVAYSCALSDFLGIPIKNPIVHPYDKIVINRAEREGIKRQDIYLALALQKINLLPDMPELGESVRDGIEELSGIWGLNPGYLSELIERSGDDVNEEMFIRTNKKIGPIAERMGEISDELSANRFARIMKQYPGKTHIFVNVESEYLHILKGLGIDTDSLFGESGSAGYEY